MDAIALCSTDMKELRPLAAGFKMPTMATAVMRKGGHVGSISGIKMYASAFVITAELKPSIFLRPIILAKIYK